MERIWSQDIFRASDGINPIQISKKYPNPKTRKIKSLMLRRVALSFLEKKIFEKNGARFILTNSQLVKNQILSHYNIQENRIHVIYNGVDTDRFNPALKTEFKQSIRKKVCVERDELLVLFAGNDPRQKGLDLLLKAVSLTGSQNIKLMVAGSFSLAQLNKMTEVIGNKSSTIFLGFEPRLELFLAAADLFILPTLYDPFSNVCLEAMACGTPVITTANNGASEIIDQGRTGFILKTSNPRELSTLINKFDTEVDKIQMSARAHQKAKHFKISRHIDNLLNLYGKVIENKESAWK
jgi:UDP-glucose:(heptosyl)LPS alpha-1,3-glucosyltransferase